MDPEQYYVLKHPWGSLNAGDLLKGVRNEKIVATVQEYNRKENEQLIAVRRGGHPGYYTVPAENLIAISQPMKLKNIDGCGDW